MTCETEYATGCCMLLSKKTMQNLGGFNEKYKMYFEDVDLCIKAKRNNIKCFFISESEMYHLISNSLGGRFSLNKYLFKLKSFIKFIYLNNNFLIFLFYLFINIISCPFTIIYFILKKCNYRYKYML